MNHTRKRTHHDGFTRKTCIYRFLSLTCARKPLNAAQHELYTTVHSYCSPGSDLIGTGPCRCGCRHRQGSELLRRSPLVRDDSRGITDIGYDRVGNPLLISFSDGSYTENVYSASGEKLRMTHATSLNGTVTGTTTTEYHGNVIYRDGKVDMVLFPGGYATISVTDITFHYYTQDYLGNNRAVINGSTGAIEQTVAYYPYGAIIPDISTNPTTGQPYRSSGKELITPNSLNLEGYFIREANIHYSEGGLEWKGDKHYKQIDSISDSILLSNPSKICQVYGSSPL
ncbi:MAG: hypothetical protein K2L00_05470 [Muribaculaceae bacterium]|nr:hypothetical protein [Muribaculaceae bacterium]